MKFYYLEQQKSGLMFCSCQIKHSRAAFDLFYEDLKGSDWGTTFIEIPESCIKKLYSEWKPVYLNAGQSNSYMYWRWAWPNKHLINKTITERE
jgi:hypothetical protein